MHNYLFILAPVLSIVSQLPLEVAYHLLVLDDLNKIPRLQPATSSKGKRNSLLLLESISTFQ